MSHPTSHASSDDSRDTTPRPGLPSIQEDHRVAASEACLPLDPAGTLPAVGDEARAGDMASLVRCRHGWR